MMMLRATWTDCPDMSWATVPGTDLRIEVNVLRYPTHDSWDFQIFQGEDLLSLATSFASRDRAKRDALTEADGVWKRLQDR
jgi:hypothetical protein